MQIVELVKFYCFMIDCVKYVYKNEGIKVFYVLYFMMFFMMVFFMVFQFFVYELILILMNLIKVYDLFIYCVVGVVVGGFVVVLIMFMDVIKIMFQICGSVYDVEFRIVNGFMVGCCFLFKCEGVKGFFKGV